MKGLDWKDKQNVPIGGRVKTQKKGMGKRSKAKQGKREKKLKLVSLHLCNKHGLNCPKGNAYNFCNIHRNLNKSLTKTSYINLVDYAYLEMDNVSFSIGNAYVYSKLGCMPSYLLYWFAYLHFCLEVVVQIGFQKLTFMLGAKWYKTNPVQMAL